MILVAALALATDRPVLDAAADAACPPAGLRAGAAYTSRCDAVAVSLARAAWYASVATWGDEQHALLRLEAASCADTVAAMEAREAYWRDLAGREAPPELPPAAWMGIGAGAGIALVLSGALAVRAVSEAPLYAD